MVFQSFASSHDNLISGHSDLAIVVSDLDAALAHLEECSLDDAVLPPAAASAVRDSLRRLISMSPVDAGDFSLQETALKRLEEVLGREHEGYLALLRHLRNAPHASDWASQARTN